MALTAPHIPLFPSKEFKGKSKIGDYGDLVMMIDDIVGRVNRKLKEIGKYDNTIVMFAADNGCAGYINMDRALSVLYLPGLQVARLGRRPPHSLHPVVGRPVRTRDR